MQYSIRGGYAHCSNISCIQIIKGGLCIDPAILFVLLYTYTSTGYPHSPHPPSIPSLYPNPKCDQYPAASPIPSHCPGLYLLFDSNSRLLSFLPQCLTESYVLMQAHLISGPLPERILQKAAGSSFASLTAQRRAGHAPPPLRKIGGQVSPTGDDDRDQASGNATQGKAPQGGYTSTPGSSEGGRTPTYRGIGGPGASKVRKFPSGGS